MTTGELPSGDNGPRVHGNSLQSDLATHVYRIVEPSGLYKVGEGARAARPDFDQNVANANFVEAATLRPGTPFVTHVAPPVGPNPSGGIEVVIPQGGVIMRAFTNQ